MVVVAGVMAFILATAGIAWLATRGDARSAGAWLQIRARGMAIDLPPAFVTSTDPADAIRMLNDAGEVATQNLAEMIDGFPDLFVLMGIVGAFEEHAGSSIMVMRVPSAGLDLDTFLEQTIAAMPADPSAEILSTTGLRIGRDGYTSFRIDGTLQVAGKDVRTVAYLVDGGAQVWIVEFATPAATYGGMAPTFERSIDSLVLP